MKISRNHTLGREEARRRVDKLAGALGSQLGVSGQWQGDRFMISGSGVNGHIAVTDEQIDVNVELGFALKILEGSIRSAVENAMDEHLS